MRHQKKRHKLGRTAAHRKRTLQALSNALIEHKRITTTEAKAKALRPFIEPLITRAKSDTSHNRRQVFRHLQDKRAVTALFTDVAVEVGERPGGYTRIVKLGQRAGDAAEMAMIELVDYNDVRPEGDESGSGGRSRTRRGGGQGRRRRSSSSKKKSQPTEEQAPETTATQTADQQEQTGGNVETQTVEEPVAEDQKVPVTERTDAGPEVDEEEIRAAQASAEEDAADTGKEAADEKATDEDEKKGEA